MNCITGLSVFLLVLLAAGPSLASGSKTAADVSAKNEVLLSYTAPLRRIVLTHDLHLVDTQEIAEYDNPVAAEPSKLRTVTKTGQVSEPEATEFLQYIRKSGFFALQAEYGGKSQERNYPYIIVVWDKDQQKQVAYYNRPDAEPRPTAFAQTEQKILEFVQQKVGELK